MGSGRAWPGQGWSGGARWRRGSAKGARTSRAGAHPWAHHGPPTAADRATGAALRGGCLSLTKRIVRYSSTARRGVSLFIIWILEEWQQVLDLIRVVVRGGRLRR